MVWGGVMDQLTDRQQAIVGLVAKGLTAKLIARNLGLGSRTVERDLVECRHKLGAKNNAQLVATIFMPR